LSSKIVKIALNQGSEVGGSRCLTTALMEMTAEGRAEADTWLLIEISRILI
jgi:hypothetical protein